MPMQNSLVADILSYTIYTLILIKENGADGIGRGTYGMKQT